MVQLNNSLFEQARQQILEGNTQTYVPCWITFLVGHSKHHSTANKPAPFSISWWKNLYPITQMGELVFKFKYKMGCDGLA